MKSDRSSYIDSGRLRLYRQQESESTPLTYICWSADEVTHYFYDQTAVKEWLPVPLSEEIEEWFCQFDDQV